MYAKVFASLYQGTLRGQAHEILVFTNLLAHADRDGYVDLHFRAIADETGLTVDQVRTAIDNLEAPDPESRTPDEKGRRIVKLDDHRAWGWRIVNYVKYRDTRTEEDRREKNRQKVAAHRAKQRAEESEPVTVTVTDCNPVTVTVTNCNRVLPDVTDVAHVEAEVEVEVEALKAGTSATPTHALAKPNRSDEFLAEWNAAVTFSPARFMTSKRISALSLRLKDDRWASEYRAALAKIKDSPFLRGEGRTGWKIDIDFFLRPDSVTKILEDKYDSVESKAPQVARSLFTRRETSDEKIVRVASQLLDPKPETVCDQTVLRIPSLR